MEYGLIFHVTRIGKYYCKKMKYMYVTRIGKYYCKKMKYRIWYLYIMIINLQCSITIVAHEYIHNVE